MFDKLIKYLIYTFFFVVPLSPWKIKYYGIPISVDFVIAFLIIFLFVLKYLLLYSVKDILIKIKKLIIKDNFLKLIVMYMVVCLLSFVKAISINASINEMLRFISYIALYYILLFQVREKRTIQTILKSALFSCLAVSIFGIIQAFTGIGLYHDYNAAFEFGVSRRIASTMFNPNNYAAFILLFSYPILLSFFYIKDSVKKRVLLIMIFVLLSINLILTFSRGAWLGFLISAFVMAIIYKRKYIFYLLVPIIPTLFIGSIRNRFLSIFSITSSANITRIRLWKTGLLMIKDNPILGVGMGNSIYVYDAYIKKFPELSNMYSMYPLHNSFIKVQAETGFLGLIFFIMIICYILYNTSRIYRNSTDNILKGLSAGLFVSFIGYIFMNFVDNCLFTPQTAVFFWLNFSVLMALDNITNKQFDRYIINDYGKNQVIGI